MRIAAARGVFLVCHKFAYSIIGRPNNIYQDAAMINLAQGQDHVSQNQEAILQSIRDLIMIIRQTQGDQLVSQQLYFAIICVVFIRFW